MTSSFLLPCKDHKVELPVEPYSDCDILWRENGTYVVNPKVPPLPQQLGTNRVRETGRVDRKTAPGIQLICC